jgi:imidazoleglycerol-phosphate dehydratase
VDVSGRPFLVYEAKLPKVTVGEFDAELAEEFLRAFAMNARFTVHVILRYGSNVHHCIEAMFKALARALDQAVCLDIRVMDVPSTKGVIEA